MVDSCLKYIANITEETTPEIECLHKLSKDIMFPANRITIENICKFMETKLGDDSYCINAYLYSFKKKCDEYNEANSHCESAINIILKYCKANWCTDITSIYYRHSERIATIFYMLILYTKTTKCPEYVSNVDDLKPGVVDAINSKFVKVSKTDFTI